MIELDVATVLLQWSTGGLLFLWFTTRKHEISAGYGWLLRGTFCILAAGAAAAGIATDFVPCVSYADVSPIETQLAVCKVLPESTPIATDLVAC